MTRDPKSRMLMLARVWAYPLWVGASRSNAADEVAEDVDFWVECINDASLRELESYSRFAYLSASLSEFRTVLHYRLRSAPLPLRLLLRVLYRPHPTLILNAGRIGPGLFIQHGFATGIDAESIGSHCWINQQVTIGHTPRGNPILGDHVRVGAGAIVIGPVTLHDGATVGANATVTRDVPPGATVVSPAATELRPRRADGEPRA